MNPQKKPKSRQEILKKQQQSTFVGREEHITAFRYNLALPPADWCFLFSVWGQGGVGKSTLLRQFRRIAEEAGFLTAHTSDSDTHVLEVMGQVAEQLEQQGHRLNQFAERYKVYLQKKQELEADPDAPQGFSAFLGKSIAKASLGLAKQVPGSGVVTPFLDEDAIANQAGDWASYVAKKIGNKDEVHLMQKPVEVLTPLFLQDLSKLTEQKNLLLLFDTYERTVGFLDSWLREILEGHYGDLPVNVILVIAGRDELERNYWTEYEGAIARISLEPFTEEEANQYLSRKEITNPQVINVILRLSGRLPLLVATLAAESPSDPTQIGDPSGTAVERFLQWVDDPKRRQVALDAALPRLLNRDVIAVLHGEESADELFNWLIKMPFVEARSDGWAYHDIARTQMLRHKRLISPQSWANLHGKLADYYELISKTLEAEENSYHQNSTWRQNTLNALYHRLCQAPQQNLSTLLNELCEALWIFTPVNNEQFLHYWAKTMAQAGKDADVLEVEHWGEQLFRGLQEHSESSSKSMIKFLENLLDYSKWGFGDRGFTYYLFGFYNKAIQEYNRAIETNPDNGGLYGTRGATFRRLGDYESAIKDLTRAIELGAINWMMHRAEVNLVLKRYSESLTDLEQFSLQLSVESHRVHYDWALAYQALNQLENAKSELERAILLAQEEYENDPHKFRNTFFLAKYYLASDNVKQAKHFYQDALSKRAPFSRIREAISDLQEFLIVFPGYRAAQQIREALLKRIGDS